MSVRAFVRDAAKADARRRAGARDDLRAELIALLERNEPAEYLVTVGRKAA